LHSIEAVNCLKGIKPELVLSTVNRNAARSRPDAGLQISWDSMNTYIFLET
jgi:hypothetical protein